MDFPAWPPVPVDPPVGLAQALGEPVQWTGLGGNGFLLALLADEATVRELRPDVEAISQLSVDVVVVTARAGPGREYDFASRIFAPNLGVNEDPVTGSAHTVLAPYWTDQLGENTLTGFQASARSGLVGVQTSNDRVIVTGRAVTILDGILTPTADPR